MDEIKAMKVIFCSKERRGIGTELDPIRTVREVFDFKGNLIADDDPERIFTKQDMARFALYVAKNDWATELSEEVMSLKNSNV